MKLPLVSSQYSSYCMFGCAPAKKPFGLLLSMNVVNLILSSACSVRVLRVYWVSLPPLFTTV